MNKLLILTGVLAAGLSALAQPNDSFANRTELAGAEVSANGNNTGATKEAGEPAHAGNAGGNSVWWSWTAPESGNVTISTMGSDLDTLLAVYTGNAVDNLTLIGQNDDAAGGRTSQVTFGAEAGTSYAIAVDGYNDAGTVSTGSIQLSIAPGTPGGGGDGDGDGDGTYTPMNAVYNGLISSPDGVAHDTAGYLTVKTTRTGRYSAKLVVGGRRYSASGALNGDGVGTGTIRRAGSTPLDLHLQVAEEGNTIYGTLSNEAESLDIVADRASYNARSNPAPQAGRYTFAFPGAEDSSAAPGGTSIGTVTVGTAGQLRFAGQLADGTKVTQSAMISERNQWPFYASVYGGQGSTIGWVTFNPDAEDDLYGPVLWTKTSRARARNYPGGFVIASDAIGSAYQPVRGSAAIDLPDGQLVLQGANLSEEMVEGVTLGSNNKFASSTGNRNLKLSLQSNTGLIKGTVTEPGTNRKLAVNGVVLQKQGYAAGYFLGGNRSGNVYVGP